MLIIERKSVVDDFGQALTRKQAAQVLGLHPTTLERWAAAGQGPTFVRLGDGIRPRVRYPRASLLAWLRERAR